MAGKSAANDVLPSLSPEQVLANWFPDAWDALDDMSRAVVVAELRRSIGLPGRSIHECVTCPHLSSSHRRVKGAVIAGPYRCLYCPCEIMLDAPFNLITAEQMRIRHAQELEG